VGLALSRVKSPEKKIPLPDTQRAEIQAKGGNESETKLRRTITRKEERSWGWISIKDMAPGKERKQTPNKNNILTKKKEGGTNKEVRQHVM